MLKTLAYFFLIYTLFSNVLFAQDVKEGLYYFNAGLANRKQNTKKYVYGIGFTYRYSDYLDILGLGLRHHFKLDDEAIIDVNPEEEIKLTKNEIELSYGLENSDTQRSGIKYPFYVRGEYKVNVMEVEVQSYLTDRYYPDFYDGDVLHYLSAGAAIEKDLPYVWESTFHAGAELSRLWHRDHNWFANYFVAFQKAWLDQYFTRVEYSDNISTEQTPHLKDWLATITLGYIY